MFKFYYISQSNPTNWISLSAVIALIAFLGNLGYQNYARRQKIKQDIANNIITTCDLLLRYFSEYEITILEVRYHHKLVQLKQKDKELEEKLLIYYHNCAETSSKAFNMTKSDLKKSVRDLNIYFDKEISKPILNIMAKVVHVGTREFLDAFDSCKTIPQLEEKRKELNKKIERHVIFESIGVHLIKIQKLIDPNGPSLYLTAEEEIEMEKLLKNYTC
jgi:hypothetical protein